MNGTGILYSVLTSTIPFLFFFHVFVSLLRSEWEPHTPHIHSFPLGFVSLTEGLSLEWNNFNYTWLIAPLWAQWSTRQWVLMIKDAAQSKGSRPFLCTANNAGNLRGSDNVLMMNDSASTPTDCVKEWWERCWSKSLMAPHWWLMLRSKRWDEQVFNTEHVFY